MHNFIVVVVVIIASIIYYVTNRNLGTLLVDQKIFVIIVVLLNHIISLPEELTYIEKSIATTSAIVYGALCLVIYFAITFLSFLLAHIRRHVFY